MTATSEESLMSRTSSFMKYGESGTGWPFYGKHGFKQPETISVEWRPINVGRLAELVKELRERGEVREEEGRLVVDLLKLGYNKLLGGGHMASIADMPKGSHREGITKAFAT